MIVNLDTKGMACPMPIIKLKKCLAENPGQEIVFMIELSDSGGLRDVPAFCQQQGLAFELIAGAPDIQFKVWRASA